MNALDENLFRDILDAAYDSQQFIQDKTRESLDGDKMLAYALVRAIEIIGEAANKISKETRASLPQIPWRNIIGMRNRIVHDYGNIDYDIVWQTVAAQIPDLITEIEVILAASS